MIQERKHEDQRYEESSDEIVEEIRAGRERIDNKLETLAEQLRPERLVDATARELAGMVHSDPLDILAGAYDKLRGVVRRHPLGSLLVAAGVAVFLMESSRRAAPSAKADNAYAGPPPPPIPPPAAPAYIPSSDSL